MQGRRIEHKHHTTEQVAGYLDDALAICSAVSMSAAAEAAVLPTLVRLLAEKTIQVEQVATGILGTPSPSMFER